jgi:hypothetical protein
MNTFSPPDAEFEATLLDSPWPPTAGARRPKNTGCGRRFVRFFLVGLGIVLASVRGAPALAQGNAIPTDGLELWVKGDGPMVMANGRITQWTDLSAKGNNAIHDSFGAQIPALAVANGQPTMRFSGAYTGFHFTKITTIRTVFAVLSKAPASCLPTLPNYGTSAKFWIGGTDTTNFHPEHGCDIYNSNLGEVSPNLVNGKTYLNGTLVDGRTTQFPFELGLLSIVSLADVTADTIARDRTIQDRSWEGDISEILIYSKPLDDATRVNIQNILLQKYVIGVDGGGVGGDGGEADALPGGGSGDDGSTGGLLDPADGGARDSSDGMNTGDEDAAADAESSGSLRTGSANPASESQAAAGSCDCRTGRARTNKLSDALLVLGALAGLRWRRKGTRMSKRLPFDEG